ncbi:hypothetical protein NQD34_002145 [Periophthalmus magnuspinnatus]|nr:hypothetical protein NQD34_002145 [Periophthalmus magnuspinnatus]
MTSNTNLQLIQYKVIHRTHITQYKKFKMGLTDTDTCSQCTMGVTDTYLHALWECSPVQGFWNTVTHKLTDILSCRIPPSPSLCLLGIITTFTIPPKYKKQFVDISNYRQENNSTKLEIKTVNKHQTLV